MTPPDWAAREAEELVDTLDRLRRMGNTLDGLRRSWAAWDSGGEVDRLVTHALTRAHARGQAAMREKIAPRIAELKAASLAMQDAFQSGNRMPTERIHITKAQWARWAGAITAISRALTLDAPPDGGEL